MKVDVLKSVIVVTPTIGSAKLLDAMQSVENQTYGNVEHLLVIDGPQHEESVLKQARLLKSQENDNLARLKNPYMILPYNVGGNGFYGHRVYAAIAHLLNCDYVAFLDEDNWYEPNHISTLVETIDDLKCPFVYSLRNIYSADKNEMVEDNCESLGMWPVWVAPQNVKGNYLVDTSSYLFKREFLIGVGNMWHWGWGADRRFFELATQHPQGPQADFGSTFKHTLNYRLDGNPNSVNLDFFKEGNKKMKEYYGEYPWKR